MSDNVVGADFGACLHPVGLNGDERIRGCRTTEPALQYVLCQRFVFLFF